MLERAGKLLFLKEEVPQEELVGIFLKGLHPVVFQQLQVFFACPNQMPKTFESVVSTTRKFANNSYVAAELAKLKSTGLSQNMFPMVQAPQTDQQTLCAAAFSQVRASVASGVAASLRMSQLQDLNLKDLNPLRFSLSRNAFTVKNWVTENVCRKKLRDLEMRPQTAACC